MSTKSQQQEHSERDEETTQQGPVSMASNANQVARIQAIQQLNTWLEGQRERLEKVAIVAQSSEANGILQTVETAWSEYEQSGYMFELSPNPGHHFKPQSAGIFLPTELTLNIRPIIERTETADNANGERSNSGIDWNTRLGIPEYRSQSDNLVAPEASCNVTTLAMILERMGIGRDDVIQAVEKQMGFQFLDSPEAQDQDWLDSTLNYLNRQMRSTKTYQRIRGQASMSSGEREDIASKYDENAQMEDLLDMLVYQMGQSRTAIISNPERLLEALTPGKATPTTEKLWERRWDKLAPVVQACIENGGGAALSFRHKGTRTGGTHIVSILAVEQDGFLIDDPYGDVREDYNSRKWDDAYWGRSDDGHLVRSRDLSSQRNVIGEQDNWGTTWARELREEEHRGRETRLRKSQIESSMFYVQLFHRGTPSLDTLSPG